MLRDAFAEALERRYTRFIERLRSNDPNSAAEEFSKICHLLRRSDLKISERVLAAFAEGWIDLFWQCRSHEQMLTAARDGREIFGSSPEWTFAEAEALFNLGHFEEARGLLEGLTQEDFDEPMLFYLLGCLAERRGDREHAARFFQTAHRLEKEGFTVPVTLTENQILELYEHCMADLPEKIQWQIKKLPVEIDDLPSDELIQHRQTAVDPLSMGVFLVGSLHAAASGDETAHPRVVLYHKNIEKIGHSLETLDDELRKTIFHDAGHYLGYNDEQLEDMGLV